MAASPRHPSIEPGADPTAPDWKRALPAEAVLLCAAALALRLPGVLLAPSELCHNFDEYHQLRSILGLFAGLAPSDLQWPCAPLRLMMTPVLWAWFALRSLATEGLGVSAWGVEKLLSRLADFIGSILYHPASMLTLGRTLTAMTTCLTPLCVLTLPRERVSRPARLITAAVLASSPLLLKDTALVKGDSIGLLFWALAVFASIRCAGVGSVGIIDALIVPAALGMAVGTRFTYAFAVFPLGAVWAWRMARERVGGLSVPSGLAAWAAAFGTIFLLPLLIFVPETWTRPLSVAKGLIGNILLLSSCQSPDSGGALGLNLLELAGLLGGALALPGALLSWRVLRPGPALVCAGVFLLYLLGVSRAGYVAPHYVLALLPSAALWSGVGGGAAADWASRRLGREGTIVAVICACLVLSNAAPAWSWLKAHQGASSNVRLADWVRTHTVPGDRIALPARPAIALAVPPNAAALRRLSAAGQGRAAMGRRVEGLFGRIGRTAPAASRLPLPLWEAVFGDEDAIQGFQWAMMLHHALQRGDPASSRDVWYYEDRSPDLAGYLSLAEAERLFASWGLDVLVTLGPDPVAASLTRAIEASPWSIYDRRVAGPGGPASVPGHGRP